MRFNKIKVTKEGKTHLEYQVERDSGALDEVSLICSDEPKPEFNIALNDLAQDVVDLCELPDGYLDRIKVTGVSFSYGGENSVMGATIIAQMTLKKSNICLNLNTPHKAEVFYGKDGDPKQLLPDDCITRLCDLSREAEDYINGIRAQGNLFGERKESMGEGLDRIAKDFHDDVQKGLGLGESVTISSQSKSVTIEGKQETLKRKKRHPKA